MPQVRQLVVCLLVALVALAGCARGPRLIPEKKMSALYADFYLADQWFLQHQNLRRTADTALVYEPILNRYGYTTDDYLYSVEYYLQDPDQFAKLVRTGLQQLEKEKNRLGDVREQLRQREAHFRHEPWTEVSFEDVDYISRSPFYKANENEKNIREIPVPLRAR